MRIRSANDIIQELNLQPLPGEGGYYRETYRSKETVSIKFAGMKAPVTRNLNTQIFYMVTENSFSALHRLKQDEIYHFYEGHPAELLLIFSDGKSKIAKLGNDSNKGEVHQLLVPAGTWQGVRLPDGITGYSLMGTSVTPGFDFADFELGARDSLIAQMPSFESLILKYTRLD